MKNITIEKFSQKELEEKGVFDWPIWTKDISKFDWSYDMTEQCYIIEGDVIAQTKDGDVHIQAGDFVTFQKGLDCVWIVKEKVRKHYNFK